MRARENSRKVSGAHTAPCRVFRNREPIDQHGADADACACNSQPSVAQEWNADMQSLLGSESPRDSTRSSFDLEAMQRFFAGAAMVAGSGTGGARGAGGAHGAGAGSARAGAPEWWRRQAVYST